MPPSSPSAPLRIQHILAWVIAGVIGLSIVAFFSLLFGTLFGVRDFSEGLWPVVMLIPPLGLPLGCVFIVVLTVIAMLRHRTEKRAIGTTRPRKTRA